MKIQYESREAIARNFFNKPNKTICIVAIDKEFSQTNRELHRLKTSQAMAEQLSIHLSKKIPAKQRRTIKFIIDKEGKTDLPPVSADVVIVISSEKISTYFDEPAPQKHEETAEWTVNYRIYLPAVYGMEPVGTFFVKERIENQAYNSKNAVNLLLSKFSSEYAWADASILMDYLRGDIRQQAFFKGKLVANGQDVFAARLLALSDWNATLKQLTQNACSETLIKAQILAPFSEQLSELVYDYAKHEPELKAKINLICYLYIAGFAQLTDLINEVLSEQKDLEDLSIMMPLVRLSGRIGNNETLEHLTRIWNGLPTETSNRTIQNFRVVLSANMKALAR